MRQRARAHGDRPPRTPSRDRLAIDLVVAAGFDAAGKAGLKTPWHVASHQGIGAEVLPHVRSRFIEGWNPGDRSAFREAGLVWRTSGEAESEGEVASFLSGMFADLRRDLHPEKAPLFAGVVGGLTFLAVLHTPGTDARATLATRGFDAGPPVSRIAAELLDGLRDHWKDIVQAMQPQKQPTPAPTSVTEEPPNLADESQITQVLLPVREWFEAALRNLQGHNAGSLEANQRITSRINDIANCLRVRFRCIKEGCGQPAKLRCKAKAGVPAGSFMFEHHEGEKVVYHGAGSSIPSLKIVAEPVIEKAEAE